METSSTAQAGTTTSTTASISKKNMTIALETELSIMKISEGRIEWKLTSTMTRGLKGRIHQRTGVSHYPSTSPRKQQTATSK